jgi:hypothetical protein
MLLTDIDIEFVHDGTVNGVPVVWVIDGDCLYDLPLYPEHAEIFLNASEVIDISESYPDHNGIVVRVIKDEDHFFELATTEYFGSILLSEPQAVRLDHYPYGRYVQSPHARFDGEKFIITNRDVTQLAPYHIQPEF